MCSQFSMEFQREEHQSWVNSKGWVALFILLLFFCYELKLMKRWFLSNIFQLINIVLCWSNISTKNYHTISQSADLYKISIISLSNISTPKSRFTSADPDKISMVSCWVDKILLFIQLHAIFSANRLYHLLIKPVSILFISFIKNFIFKNTFEIIQSRDSIMIEIFSRNKFKK